MVKPRIVFRRWGFNPLSAHQQSRTGHASAQSSAPRRSEYKRISHQGRLMSRSLYFTQDKHIMLNKLIRAFKPKDKAKSDKGLDKSEHRVHTTKYEDLCQ